MQLVPTTLPGVYLVHSATSHDARGSFVKIFHNETFAALGLQDPFRESYYTTSAPGVLRGMHLQLPPHHHAKLVYASHGQVLDVALDLRRGPTYGHYESFALNMTNGHALYLPPGIAHGFYVPHDSPTAATLHYLVTTEYAPTHDTGIRYDSFGFRWPFGGHTPVLSPRDLALPTLASFNLPF